jgi:membrane protease YdiL (CAAX protease family)
MVSPLPEHSSSRRRGWGTAGWGLAGIACGQLGGVLGASVASSLAHWTYTPNSTWPAWFTVAVELGIWAGFVGAVVVASRRGAFPARYRAFRAADCAFLAVGVLTQWVVGLMYYPFHIRHLDAPVHKIVGSGSVAHLAVVALVTVIGAPLVEELLFRGVILGGLLEALPASLPGRTLAVIVSAAIFAASHFEAAQFVGLFVAGCVLAVVRLSTGRLWPSVGVHAGFNGIALAAFVLSRGHGS